MTTRDADHELQLRNEGAALRRLARSLVGTHPDAEDLVQDTFAAALRRGSGDAGSRPWLFGTLRNLALLWRRSSSRRLARERVAASLARTTVEDPAAITAQAEAMREVAAAVHELDEPFRTVVVLRFWRGLLPEAIAMQLGVPRNTVRSRLQRGLERLRARLDGEYGDRRGWLAALAPFAYPPHLVANAAGAATSTTLGALLMTKLHVALAATALAAVGMLFWWLDRSASAPPPTAPVGRSEVAAGQATTADTTTASRAAVADTDVPPAARQTVGPATGLTVRGSVIQAGAPRADLLLTLQWFDGTETTGTPTAEHEVRSDAAGTFTWRGPLRTTSGMLRAVRAGSVGDARISCTPQLVQAGQCEAELEVHVLALDRTLSGRVHDVGGAPIAGAELTVNGWRDIATLSDADGRYELRVTGPPYPLLVLKTGYHERLLTSYVAEGKQRTELDIQLEPGAAFTGRVVDEAGRPVAGATVSASGLARGTETDAEGHFAFGGAAPDERHGLTAKKAGFQPAESAARAGGTPIELVLRPGHELAVRVLDDRGQGIPGARIAVQFDRFRPRETRGYTDAAGRLRITDLPPKPVDVIAEKSGFVAANIQADVVNPRGELVLVLRAGRAIAGRVLDQANQPIVGASVYCELTPTDGESRTVGSRATSDTAGAFTIRELPPEPCSVKAHHADFRRASLPAVTGTPSDLVVRMEPAASVAGRVVDGITGAPVAAFRIVLAADYDVQPLQYVHPVRFADCDGYWRVRHWQLQPGAALFVEVLADGYAPQRVASVVMVDAPRDQNVIRMLVGTTVRGVVRDGATGNPIAQVEVTLQSGNREDPARRLELAPSRSAPPETRVHTDDEGRFTLPCVPPGENRLVLVHDAYAKRTFGPFQVEAGVPVLDVQPTLTQGAVLRGRVTGIADPAGKQLVAHVNGGKQIDTVLGSDGIFEVRGVSPGRASLALTTAKGTWYTMRLDVGETDLTDLVFAVPAPGTGAIRATIVDLPRGQGSVAALGVPKGQCSYVRTFAYTDATLAVDGLPAGRYEVEVFDPDGSGRSGRVEVTVGTGEVVVTVPTAAR